MGTGVMNVIQTILNCLLIGFIIYSQRGIMKSFLTQRLTKSNTKYDSLNDMNRNINPTFIEVRNDNVGPEFRILLIGNSMAYHGIADNIGWNYAAGMAASSLEQAYSNIVFKKTESILPSHQLSMRVSNVAEFERSPANFDLSSFESLVTYNPHLIIFQLGENVTFTAENPPSLFTEQYQRLILLFKRKRNPITICTTPFFPSQEKNETIASVALKTNSFLADLSHLTLLEKENMAKFDKNYAGDKTKWKSSGIEIHPGDYGMNNIAKQLFIIINASIANLSNQDYKQ